MPRSAIDAEQLPPTELLNAILKAPVDLLYNGGIGTYVKASTETHAQVGDRANDALRVDGDELRCKVVAEGGNLGCTQRGRIEFALAGGRINTDAIDNSAGVDTSDHEVNLKILLGMPIADGVLTMKQRNDLLAGMTDDVAALVLRDNYEQTQVLSLGNRLAPLLLEDHARFIRFLEREGRLNRPLEFLPTGRRDRRAWGCRARADLARALGAARVREDLAVRRSARHRRCRTTRGWRGRWSTYFPSRCARLMRRSWSAIRCGARSSRR